VSDSKYGTLTIGRQYDSVVDYLAPLTANGGGAGYLFGHPYDNDNTENTFRLDNAVKYTSPAIGGFQFGGAYAFSNDVNFANDRAYSFGGQYTNGGLQIGAAYLQAESVGETSGGAITTNDASFIAQRMRVWGAGINYTFGPALVGFSYTNSSYKNPTASGYISTTEPLVAGVTVHDLKFQNFELSGKYQFTPSFFAGAEYVYTIENFQASSGSVRPKIQTAGLMADYRRSTEFCQSGIQVQRGRAESS
jgi:predicted porin